MRKLTVLAAVVILLPGAALCLPASDEQETGIAVTQSVVVFSSAAESIRGIVASVDQRNDTIAIQLAPDKTEPFRVQDGLLFDSIRYGDQVEITVQDIAGAKTIVGLREE